MKTRIKFSKGGVLRYIGHLDLMRYFQKAMRRANIPIAYSEGFHPHQKMAFALPLGVGVTSEGEYMDVTLDDGLLGISDEEIDVDKAGLIFDFEKAKTSLNETMAEGIEILAFEPLDNDAKKAMASVVGASYFVYFKKGLAISYERLLSAKENRYDKASSIMVKKQTKKSEREVDLAPHIFGFEILTIDETLNLHMAKFLPDYEFNGFRLDIAEPLIKLSLSHGSEENIKPELFLSYLLEIPTREVAAGIGAHRLELYGSGSEGKMVPLLETC